MGFRVSSVKKMAWGLGQVCHVKEGLCAGIVRLPSPLTARCPRRHHHHRKHCVCHLPSPSALLREPPIFCQEILQVANNISHIKDRTPLLLAPIDYYVAHYLSPYPSVTMTDAISSSLATRGWRLFNFSGCGNASSGGSSTRG
ncbi:hypothetical protein KSP40_PGU003202 [Platanthera guangdongensis]|uniref:Uncharacterized protein n=1 Tax=Platanthera guangdongensis TaxID=2320717 RepID=A0ABR2LYG5_9ASPA